MAKWHRSQRNPIRASLKRLWLGLRVCNKARRNALNYDTINPLTAGVFTTSIDKANSMNNRVC